MDLKIYQRQMWFTLKKYLDLISSKRDKINEKDVDKECLEVLKEIISINENQKSTLSALRRDKNNEIETSLCVVHKTNVEQPLLLYNETSSDVHNTVEQQPLLTYNEQNDDLEKTSECAMDIPESTQDQNPLSENEDLNLTIVEDTSFSLHSEKTEDNNNLHLEEPEDDFYNSPENDHMDDIHDLVTAYEFMQSLGLLTIRECEAVLHNRRERNKKNAFSYLFCQSLWEKQETKRKKRDWLLSSSPPQLRRKVRPGSHPPSQQPSRSTSPLEGGSSSPPSSLSPPSPASPGGSFNQNSLSDEICSSCKLKGANFQCDGCGVLFHTTCIVLSEEESYGLAEWLCSKCEKMGLRVSSYNDPLRQRFPRD